MISPSMDLRDAVFRLLSISLRRFSVDPATRNVSARHLLTNAVRLYAAEHSTADAATLCAETIADLVRDERRAGGRAA